MWRRRVVLSVVVVVGSLLSVAAAQAYLTQGQVRLARLQQQLNTQVGQHHDLELQVAQLEQPSHIVSVAQKAGLAVPTQVQNLPQVNLSQTPQTPQTPASHSTSTTSGSR